MSRTTRKSPKAIDKRARNDITAVRQYIAGAIEVFEKNTIILQARCDWLEDRLARLWSPSTNEPPKMQPSSTSSSDDSSDPPDINTRVSLEGTGGKGQPDQRIYIRSRK